MKETALVYYAVLSKFVQYAALATFFLSAGIAVDGQAGTLASFVRAFCIVWSALIYAALVVWVWHEGHAQTRNHALQMALLEADIATIAPPAPEAAPVAPRVPFPPMGFVSWIWDWREANGKFPTVRECVEAHKGWNGGMVQQWYQEMVNANAIINRLEKQTAGDPAPDWTRTRFEKAAADAATDYIT